MGGRGRKSLVSIALATLLAALGGTAAALPARWWPAQQVLAGKGNIGVAASPSGGFLLVAGSSYANGASTAWCGPRDASFRTGALSQRSGGQNGYLAPGSPMFEPSGASIAVVTRNEGVIGKPIEAFEGMPAAPQTLQEGPQVLYSRFIGGPRDLVSAVGPRGDVAAVGMIADMNQNDEVAVRPAGSSTWRRELLEGYGGSPNALTVDGLGDVTVLRTTYSTGKPVLLGYAYTAEAGKPFRPLTVPGGYFTAIGSDASGRTAIAGYTAEGPDGPGLYLSRRESPDQPFAAPALISASARDTEPRLAYDADGTLTIAWVDGAHVDVALAPAHQPSGAPQTLSVSGATAVGDVRLAVDPAGEAVLAWAEGAHEGSPAAVGALGGPPTPIYAAVRTSDRASFEGMTLLTTSAQYPDGPTPFSPGGGERDVVAVADGHALVAWPTQSPSGPLVDAALFATTQACAAPAGPGGSAPAAPPRVQWSRRPRRRGRRLIVGTALCGRPCTIDAVALVGRGPDRHVIARRRLRLARAGRAPLTLVLTNGGHRLVSTRPRLTTEVRVTVVQPGTATLRLSRAIHLRR